MNNAVNEPNRRATAEAGDIQSSARPMVGVERSFSHLSGYRLYQDRPFACRPLCTCGGCNGTTTGTVERIVDVIHWADGSVELVGSGGSREYVTAPHGDAC